MTNAHEELRGRGYVILDGVLTAKEAHELKDVIGTLLDATPHGRTDFEGLRTRRVYNLIAKTTAVHALAEHPTVLELAAEHLGPPGLQLSIAQAVEILPGENGQQLHTDDLPYPIPKPHQPVVLNTMWAVTEFTEANGATRLVPGSQSATYPPPEIECISAELTPGSVLVWDGSIWHGGGENSTDRSRIGVTINYNASWLRQQENQYLSVPGAMLEGMSETLRRLVGYDMCGVLGSVDGRHPLKAAVPQSRY